jgi:hypothetical protein
MNLARKAAFFSLLLVISGCSNPPSFVELFQNVPLKPVVNMVVMPDSTLRLQIWINNYGDVKNTLIANTSAKILVNGVEYPMTRNLDRPFDWWLQADRTGVLNETYSLKLQIGNLPEVTGSVTLEKHSTASVTRYTPQAGSKTYNFGSNLEVREFATASVQLQLESGKKNAWYLMSLGHLKTRFYPPGFVYGINDATGEFNVNLPPNSAFKIRFDVDIIKDFPYRVFAFSYADYKSIKSNLEIRWNYGAENPLDLLLIYEIPEVYFKYLETSNLQYNVNQLPYAEPVLIEGNLKNADGILGAAVPILIYPLTAPASNYVNGLK